MAKSWFGSWLVLTGRAIGMVVVAIVILVERWYRYNRESRVGGNGQDEGAGWG
jgi:hypothetical protein